MKQKLCNLTLIVTSLLGYLEWGQEQSMFLFQGEWEVLVKLFSNPQSVLHPFTLLPMFGQVILAYTLFQKEPGRAPTLIGLACIGLLLGFMLVVGILSGNWKIILSTLPFLVTAGYVVAGLRRSKTAA